MLLGELDINGAGVLKTLQSLDKGFGSLIGSLGKFGAVLGGSFAAFAGLQSVMNAFGATLDLGGKLQDVSNQTGETAGDLVVIRQALENAGLGADSAGDFLIKLQDSISGVNESGKSTAGALKQLGVSAGELRNLGGIEQLERLSEGFQKLDQTSRVQVGRDLFGKSGGKALSLFADGGALDQARAQAAPLAAIMEKNVETFDSLGDSINGLKLNFMEFFAGALSKIAPEAKAITDSLGALDLTALGEMFGSVAASILTLVNALAKLAGMLGFSAGAGAPGGTSGGGNVAGRAAPTSSFGVSGGVSALQRIGGGGGFGGGDPLLTESRRQTQLLERIAGNTSRDGGGNPSRKVPV